MIDLIIIDSATEHTSFGIFKYTKNVYLLLSTNITINILIIIINIIEYKYILHFNKFL